MQEDGNHQTSPPSPSLFLSQSRVREWKRALCCDCYGCCFLRVGPCRCCHTPDLGRGPSKRWTPGLPRLSLRPSWLLQGRANAGDCASPVWVTAWRLGRQEAGQWITVKSDNTLGVSIASTFQ
jgi:hypothetical protein